MAVVTDVAGVKGPVVAKVDHPRFVGGHPMAGSEQEGVEGSDPDMFEGATWVLTPAANTDPFAFATVRSVVTQLGANVVELPAARHDDLVAMVSHVPHLTAATLMNLAADTALEHATLLRLAAGGFRDMTRIAAGEPAIWPDVCVENRAGILEVLDRLLAALGEVRQVVAGGDRETLLKMLERAREARVNLPAGVPASETTVEVRVPVPDRPGVLAEVTTLLGEMGINIYDLEIAHSAEGDRGVLVLVVDAAGHRAGPGGAARAGLPLLVPAARSVNTFRRPARRRRGCRAGSGFPATSPSPTGPCCWRPGPKAGRGSRACPRGQDVLRTLRAIERFGAGVATGGRRGGPGRRGAGPARRARRAGRRRQLGNRDPPPGRVGVGDRRAHGAGRRRVDRPPAHGPGRRPAAAHGGPHRRPRTAAGCLRWPCGAAGCTGSTTAYRYRAPRSRGPSCWPDWRPPGTTTVREDVPTRVHTEELLRLCGADIDRVAGSGHRAASARCSPFDLDVPGDPSQAAFWIVAACITPGSDLAVEHVYVGPGRAGFLDVLRRMGADLELSDEDPATSTATIRARYAAAARHRRWAVRGPVADRRDPGAGRGRGLRRGHHHLRRRRRAQGQGERPHRHHGRAR